MSTTAVNSLQFGALAEMSAQPSAFVQTLGLVAVLMAWLVAACAFFEPASARPLVPAERRYVPYSGVLPACGDPAVFEQIRGRFHDRETEFWATGLEIFGFDDVKEIGYKTNGEDYIPRRYCFARAYVNDEKRFHQVFFSIAEDLGIIGFGFGIEWCVSGLDRDNAYAPNCKMARP
jgi:hypothetical protein